MLTGTISDFDADGQFGVIDADDGQLILFNLWNIEPRLRVPFEIGARVAFVAESGKLAPRAVELFPATNYV
jgi:cold shock CspA family protein